MHPRKLAIAIGTPVTTFLLVTAGVIEVLTRATGADVGPGIVGVGVGALAAVAAFLLVGWRWPDLSEPVRHALLGYATLGLAVLVLSAASYVNLPGARQYLSVPVNVGVAAAVAVAVAVAAWRADNRG